MPSNGRDLKKWFWVVLSVSGILTYLYYYTIDLPGLLPRLALHTDIIAGNADTPYQYRVLVPFTIEPAFRALSAYLPQTSAFLWSYLIYDFVAIAFVLAGLFMFLKLWFTPEQSLMGTLFAGASMAFALRDHYFQPWSILEAGLFTLALLLMFRRRYWLLALVVLIASFNRETAVFLPLTFLITARHRSASGPIPGRSRALLLAAGYFAIWLVVFAGLHLVRGNAELVDTLSEIWAVNINPAFAVKTATHLVLFLGAFWIFAILGLKRAPDFLRRGALVVPIYLAFIAVFGIWLEVRLLMPLYPLLIGLGLSYLYPPALVSEAT